MAKVNWGCFIHETFIEYFMSCQNRRDNRAEAAVFSSRLRFTAQHGQKIRRRIRCLLEYSRVAVTVTKLHTWSVSMPESDLQWKGPAWFILCFCVPPTSSSGGTLGANLPSAPSLRAAAHNPVPGLPAGFLQTQNTYHAVSISGCCSTQGAFKGSFLVATTAAS